MIKANRKNLKYLSAAVLVFGGIALFIKGYLLLKEANQLSPNMEIISVIMAGAFIVGLLKSRYLISKFNRKNIERIDKLENPKIYEFYEPRFFIFLALMIIVGQTSSILASGNYNALLIIGGINLTLSTALLKSSVVF
ncbi:MAG: hypothetical protein R3250_01050, partial [Melioribacteraceae bacterium]|nr:hypothetical protein [Melioribacteraceae bacterium]